MSERHPDSVLSNAMKREKLLTAAAVRKSSLENPDAFCKEFSNLTSLTEEIVDEHSSSSSDLFKRVSVLCAFDESVTKTALYLLARLSREAQNVLSRQFYRRLAQHVRKEAVATISDIRRLSDLDVMRGPPRHLLREVSTMHVAKLMVIADCTAVDVCMRASLVDALLTVIMSSKDVGSLRTVRRIDDEISIVTHVFALLIGPLSVGGAPIGCKDLVPPDIRLNPITFVEKAVLIRTLCHDEVLDELFKASFSALRRPAPEDNLNPSKKRCLCILLAFTATFVEMEEQAVLEKIRDIDECKKLCTQVGTMLEKLELVVNMCEHLKPGSPRFMVTEGVDTLVTATRDPFAARGVLIWATECLQRGSNLRDLRVTATAHLAFLAMIADMHVALRPAVVETIGRAMVREYPGLVNTEVADLQARFMTCLLGFIRYNMGYLIADAFVRYVADDTSVDLSHLRRFVYETLRCVKPPFSKKFADCMLRLIAHPRLAMHFEMELTVRSCCSALFPFFLIFLLHISHFQLGQSLSCFLWKI